MAEKLGKESEQHLLWHGHKGVKVEEITEGEEAFDMRFARNGRHGMGNYFAINAGYSASSYCHPRQDGNASLLYATVLVGDAAPNVDASRNKPPLKPDGKTRFDSVHEKNLMYVVYSNAKAYPMYNVIYKK